MNRILKVVAVFSLAAPLAGMAQPAVPAVDQQTHYSKQELKMMMREAHNSQQYQALADYYHQQESFYRSEAAVEKTEWDRRTQTYSGTSTKLPNPADSARRLCEAYSYNADHSGDLAHHYDQLAATARINS
jgi:hypothetical protein